MSTIMIMKETIIKTYGTNSFEAGYAQYVFAKRDSKTFIDLYNELMKKAKENEHDVQRTCSVYHLSY